MSARFPLPMDDWNAGVDREGKIYLERAGVRVGLHDRLTTKIRRELQERELVNPERGIETYPVGFLRDLRNARALWRAGRRRGTVRTLAHWIRDSWRRRSYWNGYLAEWHYKPAGVQGSMCGHGWTRRKALANLGAHVILANLHHREEDR